MCVAHCGAPMWRTVARCAHHTHRHTMFKQRGYGKTYGTRYQLLQLAIVTLNATPATLDEAQIQWSSGRGPSSRLQDGQLCSLSGHRRHSAAHGAAHYGSGLPQLTGKATTTACRMHASCQLRSVQLAHLRLSARSSVGEGARRQTGTGHVACKGTCSTVDPKRGGAGPQAHSRGLLCLRANCLPLPGTTLHGGGSTKPPTDRIASMPHQVPPSCQPTVRQGSVNGLGATACLPPIAGVGT